MLKDLLVWKVMLLMVCIVSLVNAQSASFQWAKQFRGTIDDSGQCIAVDASGNIYTTGKYEGTVDFDPGPGIFTYTAVGNSDIYISKLDPFGNLIWAKSIGSGWMDGGYSIILDTLGNLFTTGQFGGTVDFDPGAGTNNLTAAGSRDVFILKLDTSGNIVWAKAMGGPFYESCYSIALDAQGNVYTAGHFEGTADFDPGPGTKNYTSIGYCDIFISKLDSSGNFVWAKNIGGTKYDFVLSIKVDSSGNVYAIGHYEGTVDFDPNVGTYNLTTVSNSDDVYILKLNTFGNFVWVKSFGSYQNEKGNYITIDKAGNVYATGNFGDIIDFDPGPGVYNLNALPGALDIFVLKLDSAGNFIWAKDIGLSNANAAGGEGYSIALDSSQNVYSTGYFTGTVDFDPGPTIYNLTGNSTMFLLKLDSLGNFVFVKKIGGCCIGCSIAVDAFGSIYSTGNFCGTVDFNPNAGIDNHVASGYDSFIHKMKQCNLINYSQTITLCNGQSITIGGNTHSIGGVYKDTLSVPNSCDSIVTTNLTVGGIIVNSQNITICAGQSITVGQNTYDKSGIYSDILTTVNGCDSNLTTNLTVIPVIDISTTVNLTSITSNQQGASYQWIDCNGYVPIVGATNQTYTAVTNGNYAVVVSVGVCSDTSVCVPITTVKIKEDVLENDVPVYPNPNNGIFAIELNATSLIIINNIIGVVVLKQFLDKGKQTINLQSEVNGIYFIQILSEGKQQVTKLVKD